MCIKGEKKMKKTFIMIGVFMQLFTLLSCDKNKNINKTMSDYVDSLISATGSYVPAWNKENFKGRWNYIDGVFLNSIVNLYYEYKDSDIEKANKYKDFFINYINYYISNAGAFINPEDGTSGYRTTELDSVCESKILFDAYEMTNDTRYLNAINYTLVNLLNMPRCAGTNNFWHKTSYENQIWLDGMYMYAPFYARYAKQNNKPEVFDELKNQYEYIRNNMFDEEKKLYYHGHDSAKAVFWANPETGCSKSFWLRSMGWYIVSLVDVIEYFPESDNKEYLKGLLSEALEGILQYQDSKTKMFYQVVDLGKAKVNVKAGYFESLKNDTYKVNGKYVDTDVENYLEASGSSMLSYAISKAARLGYIDQSYQEVGFEIFEGIYKHSFKKNELNNICITAGLGTNDNIYKDGSAAYYLAEKVGSNDAKGVGPFIMAYLEYRKAEI